MKVHPYLAFDGNGREALDYYCETLGAELTMAMTYGEMPGPPKFVNDSNRGRLAHATIRLGDNVIYASDTPGFEPHRGFEGVTLQIECATFDEGKGVFDKLAGGGEVRMAFEETFWAKGFGMLRDKYGVAWMVNVPNARD